MPTCFTTTLHLQVLMEQHIDWVEDVLMAPKLQYLLVVLRQGITRQQLESIQPDYSALYAAKREGGSLVAICVTTAGETAKACQLKRYHWEVGAEACACWSDTAALRR